MMVAYSNNNNKYHLNTSKMIKLQMSYISPKNMYLNAKDLISRLAYIPM